MTEALPPHSPSIVARDLLQALGSDGAYRVIGTAGDSEGKVVATVEFTNGDGKATSYDVLISHSTV